MRAQLIPVDGGSPFDLTKDLIVVGRKEGCDLRLDHKSVSKMHCVLVKTEGLLLVRDLGSTNGTRVNGNRVRRAALLPNDQLTIANFKFRVQLGPDKAGPVGPEEHTQQLDNKDVADLLRRVQARARGEPESDSSNEEHPPAEPVQRNQLPDVYPDQPSSIQ
jgi:pSer/pThr/pTyr-binding forkhead associated (FHA) protein